MGKNTILVFCEKSTLLFELLGKAREQAENLGWSVAVVDITGYGESLGEFGADSVYKAEIEVRDPEGALSILSEVIDKVQPGALLVGATKLGMEVAPRLAERLSVGYAAWVVGFEIDGSTMAVTAQSMIYTGTGVSTHRYKPGLVIMTTAPGVFEQTHIPGRVAKVLPLDTSEIKNRVSILGYQAKPTSGVSLENARLILDVGQGIKEREDLQMVEKLAQLLEGELACSRPLASDRDWFSDWVGLSGAKVSPELCLTIGISGAIQHIIGIRDSRVIAAIDIDEGSPIFSQSDYGVVADLYEFLPVFAERIEARNLKTV